MSSPLILYHLRFLERYEIVTSINEGGFRRYYPGQQTESLSADSKNSLSGIKKQDIGYSDKKILGQLRKKIPLGIVLYILTNDGPVEHKTLSRNLDIKKSTLTYHLKKLIRKDIIKKVDTDEYQGYDITDRLRISKLLVTYKPTSELVIEYGRMWTDLFGDIEA